MPYTNYPNGLSSLGMPVVGKRVKRNAASLPQSTATAIYTVRRPIILVQIVGEVTTVFQTQANNMKLIANPTVGADVDLCAVADVTGNAVGTLLGITGTLATALQEGVVILAQASAIIVPAGTIDLSCSASSTGAAKWDLIYVPLRPDPNDPTVDEDTVPSVVAA